MEANERFIRLDELINETGLERSTIYRMMDNRLYHVKFKFR